MTRTVNSDLKAAAFAQMYGAGPKKIGQFLPTTDEMLLDYNAIDAYLRSKIHLTWDVPDAEADAERAYQEALGEV